jgi:hypothetical protein
MKHLAWACLFLVLGVLVLPYGAYSECYFTNHAVETKGVISKRPYRCGKRNPLDNETRWTVKYVFVVDGIEYKGNADVTDQQLPQAIKSDWWRSDALPNAYSVSVYYDPHNITDNRLEKSTAGDVWLWCLAFVLLLGGGIYQIRLFVRRIATLPQKQAS